MKTVLTAGGRGTRIASLAPDIPKPMIPLCGKPVLEREIESLKSQGFKDFIITVGYLGDKIIDYFGDGRKLGVKIEYFREETPLGSAGALLKIKNALDGDFLLLNADIVFDVDFKRFVKFHGEKGGLVTLFTHPNSHPYDSGLIFTAADGSVEKWLSKEDDRPRYYANRVNAGLHVMSPAVLDGICADDGQKVDLDRQILKPLAGTGKMFAYDSPEYVKDMGTPERYAQVSADFGKGLVEKRNLNKKQKAIFLDRDGTINEFVGFLSDPEKFRLLDGVGGAVRKINDSEYLAIVVTNQPVVARGEASFARLKEIHDKMETLLGADGAYLNAIYFCPHHPDKGFAGEVAELKTDCNCRKPKAGMLFKAAKDFNIDLNKSWMIGDSDTDVGCGKNGGTRTAIIGKNQAADVEGESLSDCVNKILGGKI